MTDVIMPKMGDGMEEGTLLEWLRKDGEKVKSGEVIGTIQTDKATLELEAPATGTLAGLLIHGGETVPVGKAIAAILKEGEKLPDQWGGAGSSRGAGASAEKDESKPEVQASGSAPSGSAPSELHEPSVSEPASPADLPKSKASSGRIKASPLARRIAEQEGVDLGSINGSGPGGRIVQRDVQQAAATGAPKAAPAAAVATADDREIQLGRLRQITAQRTAQSKQQVPHFYVTVEVDVERILELRRMFEEEESGKVSVNDFVIKACARALEAMPEVNAVFQGQSVTQKGGVHIGIAAAIDEGLTVPVMKNVGSLSLRQISEKSKELVKKARENRLSMDELSGSTFSISNMGMLDIDNFIAIINQPNSAILAISTARKKVVVNEQDEIEVRHRMNVTCSFDHRVIDGAVGARFINLVKGYLERPSNLLG
jgi:pyruvate dehydrogenase E2 component (dihydrolipoamide acetyltransferase)